MYYSVIGSFDKALSNDFLSVDDVYSVRQVSIVGAEIYAQDIVDTRICLVVGIYSGVRSIGSRIEMSEIISDTRLSFVGIKCAFGYNDVYICRGREFIVGANYPGYLCLGGCCSYLAIRRCGAFEFQCLQLVEYD